MKNESTWKGYIDELNYYSEIDIHGIANLIPNNTSNFESYITASKANVVINVISTLGFEMFGAGKKVLFGASANNFAFAISWDTLGNFNKLPDMTLLNDFNVDSMYQKLNYLIWMDNDEYINKTESARKYYMNNIDTKSADELIKDKISDFLLDT